MNGISRTQISEIFTPRRSEVNSQMYVDRPELERALLNSIQASKHSLLFGESGNGKSWLYKRVLDRHSIPYVTANCANAARNRSLTAEICSAALPPGTTTKVSYTESKGAEVTAVFAKGDLKHEAQYDVRGVDPLLLAFRELSYKAKGKESVIVFDNLESIFDSPSLMEELANIIILLDDNVYGSLKVKFLIVGTPIGVLEYFEKQKN